MDNSAIDANQVLSDGMETASNTDTRNMQPLPPPNTDNICDIGGGLRYGVHAKASK